jgi:hypothetical protein
VKWERLYLGVIESITSEGSQALPARPSDKGSMNVVVLTEEMSLDLAENVL